MTGRLWTISNILSLIRIVLVLPIILLIVDGESPDRLWAVALMAAAALTDAFDGILARALDQVTDIGKILDPLADKLAIGAIGLVLVLQGDVPIWFFTVALVRDILILAGGIYVKNRLNLVPQSNTLGKWTVTVIAAYVGMAAFEAGSVGTIEMILLVASTVMITISFVVYVRRFLKTMKAVV